MLTLVLLCAVGQAEPLPAGDHYRYFNQGEWRRRYLVHVPEKVERRRDVPVVLVLHGAAMNAARTVSFTGMNAKADEAGFLAVYPEGTGFNPLLTWNVGGMSPEWEATRPDDVAYIRQVLKDLDVVASVDRKRIYATGMSNGGMMCYRLAQEMSERIAAIAPVAGTMTLEHVRPVRPVPVLHFHGRDDTVVPYAGPAVVAEPGERTPLLFRFRSVDATIQAWVAANGCSPDAVIEEEPTSLRIPGQDMPQTTSAINDGTQVRRHRYAGGRGGAEVILMEIAGGGHTWPGMQPVVSWLGKSTRRISANDLIWDFFQRHPLP